MRYDRTLSKETEELLTSERYSFLLKTPIDVVKDDPYRLDIQIREQNEIMMYHGGTRILRLALSPRMESKALPFTFEGISNSYTSLPEFQDMRKAVKSGDLCAFREAYPKYIESVFDKVNDKWYGNGKEGCWENKLCVDFGRDWEADDEWLIVDREIVFGFESKEVRERALLEISRPYVDEVEALKNDSPEYWGTPTKKKTFGGELDMLAIDKNGNLILIELKYGEKSEGIYWGPYQAAVYLELGKRAIDSLVESVPKLVEQKVRLGLLPESAAALLPLMNRAKGSIRAALLVAAPRPRSNCWEKLKKVASQESCGMEHIFLIGNQKDSTHRTTKLQPRQVLVSDVPGCI